MAEVAGGGEVGRAAVLVAAVAGDRIEFRLRLGQLLPRAVVEREPEDPAVVLEVARFAGARAHDHPGDGGLLQRVADRHIGEGDPEAVRDPARRPQQRWKRSQPPACSMNRWYFNCDHGSAS